MSYCVNCGVELAPSEKVCPLCDTPVLNPNDRSAKKAERPYPRHLEKIDRKIDRRYGVALGTIILAIPLVVSLLADMIISGRLSWSLYVAGALFCVFVWFLLPFLYGRDRPYLAITTDALAAGLYLAVISYAGAHMAWFLPLAAPLVIAAAVCAALTAAVLRSKLAGLYKPAAILMITGVLAVASELTIDMYLRGALSLSWSVIAFVVCLLISFMLMLIEKKQKLKEDIKKRLFL